MQGQRNLYRRHDGRWACDFTCNKQRVRQVFGRNKSQASEIMKVIEAEIIQGTYVSARQKQKDDPRFHAFATKYLEMYSIPNKRSWKRDEGSIKTLKAHFGNRAISTITPERIERLKCERLKHVTPSTVNRDLALLKHMFTMAIVWDLATDNPVKKVKMFTEEPKERKIFSDPEIERLFWKSENSKNPHLDLFNKLSLNTAMRPNEVLSLEWKHINFHGKFISIEAKNSKSRKGRRVPMNDTVLELLANRERTADYVFSNPKNGTHIKSIRRPFATACKHAKITGVSPYSLRHTTISKMVNEYGIDIVTVAKIVGHSTITVTQRYVHPTRDHEQRAVDALNNAFQTRHKLDTPKGAVDDMPPVNQTIS